MAQPLRYNSSSRSSVSRLPTLLLSVCRGSRLEGYFLGGWRGERIGDVVCVWRCVMMGRGEGRFRGCEMRCEVR